MIKIVSTGLCYDVVSLHEFAPSPTYYSFCNEGRLMKDV